MRRTTDEELAGRIYFGLWKFDMEASVWKMAELIPAPPLPVSEIINNDFRFIGIRDLLLCSKHAFWVYDMTHQSWVCLREFLTPTILEATLFRVMA